MTFPVATFATMIVIALAVNIASPDRPTDGAKFIGGGVWLCAVWAFAILIYIIRRNRRF